MSKSSYRDLILLVIMIVILGAMYAASTWSQNRPWCVGRDENICKMLTHMKSHLTSASQGTYSDNDNINVLWGVYEGAYEFSYLVNKEEVMHVIGVEDTMYIRDYTDNRWWKQPAKLVEQYNVQLPFEPKWYTQHILEEFIDANTTYTATQATTCSVRNCWEYHVMNKNTGLEMIISIDKEAYALVAFEVRNAGEEEKVTVQYKELDPIEVPATEIKIASSNQNIFLDMTYQLDPRIDTVPDYVDLIEQQRQQAEQRGESNGAPQYIDLRPTITFE